MSTERATMGRHPGPHASNGNGRGDLPEPIAPSPTAEVTRSPEIPNSEAAPAELTPLSRVPALPRNGGGCANARYSSNPRMCCLVMASACAMLGGERSNMHEQEPMGDIPGETGPANSESGAEQHEVSTELRELTSDIFRLVRPFDHADDQVRRASERLEPLLQSTGPLRGEQRSALRTALADLPKLLDWCDALIPELDRVTALLGGAEAEHSFQRESALTIPAVDIGAEGPSEPTIAVDALQGEFERAQSDARAAEELARQHLQSTRSGAAGEENRRYLQYFLGDPRSGGWSSLSPLYEHLQYKTQRLLKAVRDRLSEDTAAAGRELHARDAEPSGE